MQLPDSDEDGDLGDNGVIGNYDFNAAFSNRNSEIREDLRKRREELARDAADGDLDGGNDLAERADRADRDRVDLVPGGGEDRDSDASLPSIEDTLTTGQGERGRACAMQRGTTATLRASGGRGLRTRGGRGVRMRGGRGGSSSIQRTPAVQRTPAAGNTRGMLMPNFSKFS